MSDNVIRISYVRATFAAGLLEGCRSSLLTITDLLDFELDAAQVALRRSGDCLPSPEPVDKSHLVAAALFAEWIADALHRQIAFYTRLDSKIAGTFDNPELPPTESDAQAPPEWPQPPLPAPLEYVPNPLAGIAKSSEHAPRSQIAARMQEIAEDIDDAIRAIDWSRRLRYQAEIRQAAERLRNWVAASLPAVSEDS